MNVASQRSGAHHLEMAPEASVVRVEYRKYDGSPHRSYPAVRLGSDAYGDWLGVPSEFMAATDATFKYTDPYVLLVPAHAWWTAMFNPPPRHTEVYCDIATPAAWEGDHVRLTDLDLDVRRRREGGAVELLDEDEFAAHRVRFGYPDEVVGEAFAAAKWLLAALDLRRGEEPFTSAFRAWLGKVA
jgi:protein associated with RNAse G/E